jgi:hypothetical protein
VPAHASNNFEISLLSCHHRLRPAREYWQMMRDNGGKSQIFFMPDNWESCS